jgi:predicted hydrocarbon binding protein
MTKNEEKWIEKLVFNESDGSIRIFGVRHTIINSDTFCHIRDSMAGIVGPAADTLLYMSAKKHTAEYLKDVLKNSRVARMASKFRWGREKITEKAAQILTEYGFGKVEIMKLDLNGKSVAIVRNSCIAESYRRHGKTKTPTCSYIAGLLAGGASTINKINYECHEVECYATGGKVCKFILERRD